MALLLDRSDVGYVNDQDSAARLYLELKAQLANPHLTNTVETKAAIAELERQWPGVSQHAANAASEQLGGLSPALKRTRDAHRREQGVTAQQAARARRSATAPPNRGGGARTKRRPPSRGAGRRRALRGAPGRIIGEASGTVAPAADLMVKTIGVSIAFAVLYALITNADRSRPGRSAIELASKSFTTALNLIVRPIDPLASDALQRAGRSGNAGSSGVVKAPAGTGGPIGAGGPTPYSTPGTRNDNGIAPGDYLGPQGPLATAPSRPIQRTHTKG